MAERRPLVHASRPLLAIALLLAFTGAVWAVVEMGSFQALPVEGPAVLLGWQTTYEVDALGFCVQRSAAPDSGYERVSDLILAVGDVGGASYEFTDASVGAGQVYYYRLEAVDLDGQTAFHGPISITLPGVPTNMATPSNTPTHTPSAQPTATATNTRTATPAPTGTALPTSTPAGGPKGTRPPQATPTAGSSPGPTATLSQQHSPIATPLLTPSPASSPTPAGELPTQVATASPAPAATRTPLLIPTRPTQPAEEESNAPLDLAPRLLLPLCGLLGAGGVLAAGLLIWWLRRRAIER